MDREWKESGYGLMKNADFYLLLLANLTGKFQCNKEIIMIFSHRLINPVLLERDVVHS